MLGLMGKPGLPASGGLLLYDTNWVHTFCMRFPLDLIYINRRRVVVGLESVLAANRIGKPFFNAYAVVELPAGAIRASGTQVGDELEIREAGTQVAGNEGDRKTGGSEIGS